MRGEAGGRGARQVGSERYNLFTGCPKARTATFVLRGGSEQFLDEADRSLHDAIMIVRRALKNTTVVAGGGAIDMELSKHLRWAPVPQRALLLTMAACACRSTAHLLAVSPVAYLPMVHLQQNSHLEG